MFECYSKPMTVLDYNALKDHPLIDATTIGLKGSDVYKRQLLIGTIIKTLGAQLGVPFLTDIGTYAMRCV